MDGTVTRQDANRLADGLAHLVRQECETILQWCRHCASPFAAFEAALWVRVMRLACLLVRVFLTACRERSDLQAHLADGTYRLGDSAAKRRLHTRFGKVTYTRPYLIR